MRNLINFDLSKKITEQLSFMTLESDEKFEGKPICGLENDMRHFAKFYQSSHKSQNLNFHWALLSKVEIA